MRYKTQLLKASPKKLMPLTRMIKGQKLNKVIDFLDYYKKGFSHNLKKSLLCMRDNLIKTQKLDANTIEISKICIEINKKFYGIRYKARGASSKSIKYCCLLNIYFQPCHTPT